MSRFLPEFILIFMLFAQSCIGQKNMAGYGDLKGMIGVYEGNCMPQIGVPPCEPNPISTTVLITQLSEDYQEGLLVDSVRSDKNGAYTVSLKEGTYSLFLRDGERVVCDLIQCPDQCYCQPFTITADSTTVIDANLDHATW